MKEDFVELKLQFLKGEIKIENSKNPELPDGRYQSYSRLVKKIGDKLYLEIAMLNKDPHLRCNKCKRRVPFFYPYGYIFKQVACSEEQKVIICLDCLNKSADQELAYFVMNYGQYDAPLLCEKCPDKNNPESCPVKQKWQKVGTEINKEIDEFLAERERKKR